MARIAAGQRALVTTAQLMAAGLGPGAIHHRVRRKRLHRLHRGVYSLVLPLLPGARELGAVLACGRAAMLSHISAAVLLELIPAPRHDAPLHVTVVRREVALAGIVTHETTRREGTAVGGIPCTTALRTLLDLAAAGAPDPLLDRALNEAQVRRLVTARQVAGLARRPGAARLRALVAAPSLLRSEAERRALALIRAARLPEPETNARQAGHEVDLLWRRHRLVAEIDGFAFHGTSRAFERDRRRDADLERAGLHVLRLSWRMLADEPHAAVALLAARLARAA